ncbi:MAG: hypothetical protein K0R40_431 [Burkholderiales bacterium]|jgi:hypothetical protein|nr:hypothetical protein [Burkholderiales bacterium]
MPVTRKQNVGDTARAATRQALSGGKLDRAAVRRIANEVRKSLQHVERLLAHDLRRAANAGKDAATQSVNATLLSGAMAARIASGMLAGIADSLAAQKPRRRR